MVEKSSRVATRRRASAVSHPRWRLWMLAVSDAKEKGPSRLTKSLNYWSTSINRNKKGNYNDVLIGVLNDVGTYLNRYTSDIGDYRIAIPIVSKQFNLEPSIVKTIFFEKGALAQSLLQFDLSTDKQGHADSLLRAVEEYKAAGAEFNTAKNAVSEIAKSMRTKNPEHRQTMLEIINHASNYDELRGGLMHAKLSFEGMGVNLPAASKHATISVILPWKYKNTIQAAQKAARTGKVLVKGSRAGCEVSGTIHRLADLGIVKHTDAKSLMGPIRQAGASTIEGRKWTLPGGFVGAEIMTRLDGRTASLLASQLVDSRNLLFAVIYDKSGTPHTKTRKSNKRTAITSKKIYMESLNPVKEFKRVRKASLTTSLQDIWEELAEQVGESLDAEILDVGMVHEIVMDHAAIMLKDTNLKEWNELDAEGQVRAIAEAFPNSLVSVREVQEKHLRNRTRGATKIANCDCDSDPTDLIPEDDSFESVLQNMILGPKTPENEPAIILLNMQ